jgi:ferredoxin-NADP reductase
MARTFYNGEVIKIIDETHNIKRFFIQIPEVEKYEFKAGQFTMLDLPIPSKVTTRAYSIASPPDGNVIELIIVLNEAGLGTPYLFNEIKVGSIIKTSPALGKFILPETLDRDICFICTGVGIAPFRAMTYYIFNNNIPHKKIYLVFGTRYKSDLCYPQEFSELGNRHISFEYHPVLSRETAPDWKGKKGYVHTVYKELFADKRPAYFYLCGWKTMIYETRDNLLAMGYVKENIHFELYD